jgi:phosphonate metabolism protein PhnN/1,5-bisphosphokinase (PRPP-forming)
MSMGDERGGDKGLWIFVCGPSGAGKDSVINWAAQQLAQRKEIVFSRRLVTRPSFPGSDHDEVTRQQLARKLGSGGLVWCWEANGQHYGIEAHYAAQVKAGRVVVVNGSREHASGLHAVPQVRVVHVVAEAGKLAARLEQRGREAPQEVARRLARNALFPDLQADCTIVNEGALEDAGQVLTDYLMASAG